MTYMPPAPYDAPAPSYVVEHIMSFEQLARICHGTTAWACSRVVRDAGGAIVWCDVYLPAIGETRINERKARVAVSAGLQNDFRRHENGHCNGWPDNHVPAGHWKEPTGY